MDAPARNDTDKMNNQKLSSSFDDKNRSRSVSPEITKFEEPGMFVLLDEEILANRKGRQFRRSLRDINPKAIDLPNVGLVILHQEDPKMKVEESNGEMKSLTRRETQVKRLKDHSMATAKLNKSVWLVTNTTEASKYSVVSIKRTGCNKRTGWSKNFI